MPFSIKTYFSHIPNAYQVLALVANPDINDSIMSILQPLVDPTFMNAVNNAMKRCCTKADA
jgi:hypothetical protein